MQFDKFINIKKKDGNFYCYGVTGLYDKEKRIGTVKIEMPNCKIKSNTITVLSSLNSSKNFW